MEIRAFSKETSCRIAFWQVGFEYTYKCVGETRPQHTIQTALGCKGTD